MNAFDAARKVEARGMATLRPWLEMLCARTGLILFDSGPRAFEFQQRVGDGLVTAANGVLKAFEVKVEGKYTGRLFIEWMSNEVTGRLGWGQTCTSDLMLFYFIDRDYLLIVDWPEVRKWLIDDGNIRRYRKVEQRKYRQLNQTTGYIVPISDVFAAMRKLADENGVAVEKYVKVRHPADELPAEAA